jgi:hypothetical protein
MATERNNKIRLLSVHQVNIEFNRRFRNIHSVLVNNWSALPLCVAKAVRILFNLPDTSSRPRETLSLEGFKYPPVNEFGLAPPSAHQLLIPSLSCVWFPASFGQIYATLKAVSSYDGLIGDILDIKVSLAGGH